MNVPRSMKIVLLTSILPLDCTIESSPEGVDTVGQAIINGATITSEDIRLVKVLTRTSGCSGPLITTEWVHTTLHCLPAQTAGTTIERTTTGDMREAIQLIPYSNINQPDSGPIRAGAPFPTVPGANGYTNNLWPFARADPVPPIGHPASSNYFAGVTGPIRRERGRQV